MKEIFHEFGSFIKEILSLLHWISIITLVAGLGAVAGSFEQTINYMIREMIIPSILMNILTGILMEIFKTRFPSIYRLMKNLLS